MEKSRSYSLVLLLVAIPLIIYFFFLQWQPTTIYGDDLITYMNHSRLHGFADKMSLPIKYGKYRPVNGFALNLLIGAFQKNLTGYYLFNIGIQAINTFMMAMLVNLFVKSVYYSTLIALIAGLSRFGLFNITQLLFGGSLEGLAMSFFLLFLIFIMRPQVKKECTSAQRMNSALLCILFANVSMYTHERYIMIFPFIILAVLFLPGFRLLTGRQKGGMILLAVASVGLNYFIKTSLYSLPFFMGTANAKMAFSLSDAISFYRDAILSVIQINSGPEYLVGITFGALPASQKVLVAILVGGLMFLLVAYVNRIRKSLASNGKDRDSAVLIVSLAVLMNLLLLPAISTIRLEQRWIQAPFAVFVLIIAILLSEFPFTSSRRKAMAFGGIVLLYVFTDFLYLSHGSENFSMIYSERTVTSCKEAIEKGVIHAGTRKLYIWEKKRSSNNDAGIAWELGDGLFFEFYQGAPKKIYFVDSIYDRAYPGGFSSFGNFDTSSAQIVYLDRNVIDITDDYIRDSLKVFTTRMIDRVGSFTSSAEYNQRRFSFPAADLDRLQTKGLYEDERGLRWTSGDATIQLSPARIVEDSFAVELNAYLPAICKNIVPQVTIEDDSNKIIQPLAMRRTADKFIYRFGVDHPIEIRAINILSDTLVGQFADGRRLSFPLSGLDLIFLR